MSRRPGRDVAAEIDRLVDALGLDEWNLFGASYGSRLALVTLRDHPDGIRSVLLEGVFPPDVVPAALEDFDNALRGSDEVAVACAADAGCASQSGPNPPQLLDRLRSRFQIAATGASPYCIDRPSCGGHRLRAGDARRVRHGGVPSPDGYGSQGGDSDGHHDPRGLGRRQPDRR